MLNFNPKYTFDNFVVGESNVIAFLASWAVMEDPGKVYNPLFIYGGTGVGKTHLLNAIGLHLHKHRPDMKVAFYTARQLIEEILVANKSDDPDSVIEQLDRIDIMMIEEMHYIFGKPATQNEFFSIFNALYMNQKQIIITSDLSSFEALQLHLLQERIHSRFTWGMQVEIKQPDLAMKLSLLQRIIERYRVSIDMGVLMYVEGLPDMTAPRLEGAVKQLIFYSNTHSIPSENLTEADARKALEEITKPS